MPIKYCPNCMNEIEGGVCKHCDFDFTEQRQDEYALKWNTLLHKRYITGKVLGQNALGLTYLGYDTLRREKVTIKELYPRTLTNRGGGGEVIWPDSFPAEKQDTICKTCSR